MIDSISPIILVEVSVAVIFMVLSVVLYAFNNYRSSLIVMIIAMSFIFVYLHSSSSMALHTSNDDAIKERKAIINDRDAYISHNSVEVFDIEHEAYCPCDGTKVCKLR